MRSRRRWHECKLNFYHLTRDPAPEVLPAIASRVIDGGGRLLVVGGKRRFAQRDFPQVVGERKRQLSRS